MPTDTAHHSHVGEHRRAARATEVPTVGVEEELILLDSASGVVVPAAADVIRECRNPAGVVAESMRFMVETRTPVCSSLAEVHEGLSTMRRRVSAVAVRPNIVTVASGVPPFGMPDPPQVTDEPRYHELARRFPLAMRTNGICGCHVHVGVATRQVGVEALRRLRAWLPPLIALTANSPIWEGEVTSWASRRFLLASRWPTVMPAPPSRSVEEYDHLLRQAIASGKALDVRNVYFLARLSPRYPTIEVRAADMCLTVDEAVAYAGLVRALVSTAVDEAAMGRPVIPVRQALLRQSCLSAARAGLDGTVTDPQTGSRVPAWDLIDALVARVQPVLCAHGDEARVLSVIDRVRAVGGGADRQRRLFRVSSSPGAFAAALATGMTGL
jgi:glutamate---cysteine ligase / carboxylate-amine ligase